MRGFPPGGARCVGIGHPAGTVVLRSRRPAVPVDRRSYEAERIRLHTDLQARLDDLSRAFNRDLASACLDLIPSGGEIEAHGREAAYSMQYARWRNAHERVLARVAIAVPEDEDLHLLELDLNTARFSSVSWPESWAAMHQRLIERLERRPLQANDWQEAPPLSSSRASPAAASRSGSSSS